MFSDYGEASQERDRALVFKLCAAAETTREALLDWMQEEIRMLRPNLQVISDNGPDLWQPKARQHLERIEDIDYRQIPELKNTHKDRVALIRKWRGVDPVHTCTSLEEAIHRIEVVARTVYELRNATDELLRPAPDPDDGDFPSDSDLEGSDDNNEY
jgi:hypothetical protein